MKTPTPNTPSMDTALLAHAKGGEAIRKPELYIHSTREAIARAHGFPTWEQYEKWKDRETARWWRSFAKETT